MYEEQNKDFVQMQNVDEIHETKFKFTNGEEKSMLIVNLLRFKSFFLQSLKRLYRNNEKQFFNFFLV